MHATGRASCQREGKTPRLRAGSGGSPLLSLLADARPPVDLYHPPTLLFLERLGLLIREEEQGKVYWRPAEPLPLPIEAVPLMTPAERAENDRLRWQSLHEGNSFRVANVFVNDGVTTLRTTLSELGGRLDLEAEDVREGILILLDDGDFSASADVGRLKPSEMFELTIDWDAFREGRIMIAPAEQQDE